VLSLLIWHNVSVLQWLGQAPLPQRMFIYVEDLVLQGYPQKTLLTVQLHNTWDVALHTIY